MSGFDRVDRLSEEVRRVMDGILRNEVKDPRIVGTFSITRCEVTKDLRHAKVYVSILEEDKRKGFMEALQSAQGFIKTRLGKELDAFRVPDLKFVLDQNIEYSQHIAELMKEVSPDAEGAESTEESN